MKKVYCAILSILLCANFLFSQNGIQVQKALEHLEQKNEKSQFTGQNFKSAIVTDNYTSRGITHIYLRQSYDGIEIHGANAAVHMKDSQVLTSNSRFLPDLAELSVQKSVLLSAEDAVLRIAEAKKYPIDAQALTVLKVSSKQKNQRTTLSKAGISRKDIPAELRYFQIPDGSLRLSWEIEIEEVKSPDYMVYKVDVATGKILDEYNRTIYCDFGDGGQGHASHAAHECSGEPADLKTQAANSYNVYALPLESPLDGNRTIESAPWLNNPTASPDGWHSVNGVDYTTTQGNNVDAYMDDNNTNAPSGGDAARADGGATLDFNFPLDLNEPSSSHQDASVTNLFYWGNIVHDVLYNYGFDEPSGNFQIDNYDRGGLGDDYVKMEAQDGSGTCNANYSHNLDGGSPRIQMYTCDGQDGSLDNGIIIHEYVHGVSVRLVGGPATACLSNAEQMGEGWSDYYAHLLTMKAGDTGADPRPIGEWVFSEGIRPFPYSTDMEVNPMTYAIIPNVSRPHGVGSVWATMLWEMTWGLIDEYGFDSDIYNGTGGNNMALMLVTEALKLTPCSPGFVDGRDAILAADQALYGGANECIIWEAFAKRGLGYSAIQGLSTSINDGSEAFDLPPSCSIGLIKTADKTTVNVGENITYTITATNTTDEQILDVIISDILPENTSHVSGGTLSGQTVSFPSVSLALGQSHTVSFTVQVDPTLEVIENDLFDDMENGTGNWMAENYNGDVSWQIAESYAQGGTKGWFISALPTSTLNYLQLSEPIGLSANTVFSFEHAFNTQNNWDGGRIFISTDFGQTWTDLKTHITANPYNAKVNGLFGGQDGWSGNSEGFIKTEVDLSSFAGELILLRFQFSTSPAIGGNGWIIDNILISNTGKFIPNTATVSNGEFSGQAILDIPTTINPTSPTPLSVHLVPDNISCTGAVDGSITALPYGGSGNYTYNWSNGTQSQSISNLPPDNYTVTVSDGNTTTTSTIIIYEPLPLTVNMASTPAVFDYDGTISSTTSGGSPYFSYDWSHDEYENQNSLEELGPGNYQVTISDVSGCTTVGTIEVENLLVDWCSSYGATQTDEYIEAMSIGNIQNQSGNDGGYGDYTNLVVNAVWGEPVNIEITPYNCCGLPEVYAVFIDYNQDFDFLDPGETVFEITTDGVIESIPGSFTIPLAATTGQTRLRVINTYGYSLEDIVECGELFYGETEDYTINISSDCEGTSCNNGDPCTLDILDSNCNCISTYIDSDGDGLCIADDCDDNDPNIGILQTPGIACNDNDSNTIDDVIQEDGCTCLGRSICYENEVTITIVFDNFPEETSWGITNDNGTIVASSNGTYSGEADGATVVENVCLPDGCFDFTIYDSANDGICCSYGIGNYTVSDENGNTLASGAEFTSPETTNICVGGVQGPCDNNGGDSDGDGVCADVDCDDSNPSIGGAGASCDDGDTCTTNDVYDANCNCAGTLTDADNDGVCDADDLCPGFDDASIGTSCDDGDACTTGDVWGADCNCAGTLVDADNDGVCDADDLCPGFDDASIGTSCDDGDACTTGDVWGADCNCAGTLADADNDGVCDADDLCPGFDDASIGTSCDDGDACTTGDVWGADCNCAGTFADADNDGICDSEDVCQGLDDALIGTPCDDGDSNTTNDTWGTDCNCAGTTLVGCTITTTSGGSVQSSNGSQSCRTFNFGDEHQDISFALSGINSRVNGKPASRYIDLVTVQYVDANGTTQTHATYTSNGTVNIAGPATSLIICIQDNDGSLGASVKAEVGTITSCVEGVNPPACTPGDTCDDGDACTTGDVYDANCDCGGTSTDADGDGVCAANDPNDNDPCIPNACGDCMTYNSESFEGNWGIWNDGGNDVGSDAVYANTGTYCVRLRDNSGQASSIYTDALNLSTYSSLDISFSFFASSMETGEDFYLEMSTNSGSSYTTVQRWVSGTDFINGTRYNETVSVSGFSSSTVFRIRCDASANNDRVYIDDVVIEDCSGAGKLETEIGTVNIFPNPSDTYINVDLSQVIQTLDTDNIEVNIFSLDGKRVYQNEMQVTDMLHLNIEALSSSQMYLLHLRTEDGRMFRGKFVKF